MFKPYAQFAASRVGLLIFCDIFWYDSCKTVISCSVYFFSISSLNSTWLVMNSLPNLLSCSYINAFLGAWSVIILPIVQCGSSSIVVLYASRLPSILIIFFIKNINSMSSYWLILPIKVQNFDWNESHLLTTVIKLLALWMFLTHWSFGFIIKSSIEYSAGIYNKSGSL